MFGFSSIGNHFYFPKNAVIHFRVDSFILFLDTSFQPFIPADKSRQPRQGHRVHQEARHFLCLDVRPAPQGRLPAGHLAHGEGAPQPLRVYRPTADAALLLARRAHPVLLPRDAQRDGRWGLLHTRHGALPDVFCCEGDPTFNEVGELVSLSFKSLLFIALFNATWHNTANVLFMTFPLFETDADVIAALVATYKTSPGTPRG